METPPDPEGNQLEPGQEEAPGPEVSLRRIQVINLVLVAAGSAAGLALSNRFALGVLTGGLLMAASFRVIAVVIRAVFLKGSTSPANVGIYWLKFTGMMLLVGYLVLKVRVDAIGLLLGLSGILVAITAEAVFTLLRR